MLTTKTLFLYSSIQIKAQVSALLAYTDSTVSTTVQKTQFSKEENNETISLFCTCTGTDSRMGLLLTGCGRQKSEMPEETATSMLNAYSGQIDGIWNFSDTPAQGAVSAVEAAGLLDDILISGADGSVVAKELIQQGKQYGSAAQFPVELGYQGVMTAYDLLVGVKPEEQTVYVDVAWIGQDNVKDYIEEN